MSSIVSDCGEATPQYATVFPIPRAATKGGLVEAHRCRPGSNILKIGFAGIRMSKRICSGHWVLLRSINSVYCTKQNTPCSLCVC